MALCGSNTNELIVFVHTPKIGGTSLHALLEKNYPEQGMLFRRGHRMTRVNCPLGFDIEDLYINEFIQSVKQKPSLKYIGGHLPFGIHEYLDRPCVYITILRDPLSRVQSLFRHVLRCENDVIYDYWKKYYGFDCASILRDNDMRVCNDMIRMVTGGNLSSDYAVELLKTHYACVGLLENIESFVKILTDKFNWKHSVFPFLNKDETTQLSEEMEHLILNHNKLDDSVYQQISHHLLNT